MSIEDLNVPPCECDQLRADLARITAERDGSRANNKLLDNENHALRARVAELTEQLARFQQRDGACAQVRLEQADQRNAELVAALRDLQSRVLAHDIPWVDCAITDLLTCAESAAPSRNDIACEHARTLRDLGDLMETDRETGKDYRIGSGDLGGLNAEAKAMRESGKDAWTRCAEFATPAKQEGGK